MMLKVYPQGRRVAAFTITTNACSVRVTNVNDFEVGACTTESPDDAERMAKECAESLCIYISAQVGGLPKVTRS